MPQPKTSRDWARLRGPVKMVATEEVGGSDTAYTNTSVMVKTVVYNETGDRIAASWDTVGGSESEQPAATHGKIDTISPLDEGFLDPGNRLTAPRGVGQDLLRCLIALVPQVPGAYQRYFYNSNGSLRERYVHYDDPSGAGSRWSRYDAEGDLVARERRRYNDKGACIETFRYNGSDALDYHWRYGYDDYGNVVEITSYNQDGTLRYKLAQRYEYDEWGNWITKTTSGWTAAGEFESGGAEFQVLKVTRRTITYY